MVPVRLSATAFCACLIAGLAGGAFGAYRTARGIAATVVDWDGLRETTSAAGSVRVLDGHATLALVSPDWRPLTVRLALVMPDAPPPEPAVLRLEADGWPIGEVRPAPGRSTHVIRLRPPAARREKLQLRFLQRGGDPIAIASLDVVPEVKWTAIVKHSAGGALAGIVFVALWLIVRMPAPRPAADTGTPGGFTAAPAATPPAFGRRLAVFAGIAVYLAAWACIKPVLQAPDEPQHLLKANGVLLQPWLTAAAQFDHDPRFVNPLAVWTPPELGRVFFHGGVRLSAADLDVLKRVPWPAEDWLRELRPYRVALASYPASYYLATFALSEPVIALTGATAYQAIFVYRFATVLLAALAWTAVYVELRCTADLRPRLGVLLVFLLANPMLAFVSSAVNTDALAIPLCVGGALAGWRLLTSGTGSGRALVWLILAGLVKPAGLQMIVAVAAASVVTWYLWRAAHLAATLVTTARALATSFAAFYAWSYIHLYASPPTRPSLVAYAGTSVRSIGEVWVMYWGQLGWLDYSLPDIFYILLLLPIAWAAREAWRRPELGRPAQVYFAVCFVGFAATMYAVEWIYLHEAGYFIQGRYFLPASIGLAPLLFHRAAAARATLVASVVVMNVLLFGATVQRYYASDWHVAWHALPVAAPSPPPATVALPAAARAAEGAEEAR